MPEQPPELPDCDVEDCPEKATWKVPFPDHQDFYCVAHVAMNLLHYAATRGNNFKPFFIQANPVVMPKEVGQWTHVFIFVCGLGHIGFINLYRKKQEMVEMTVSYRSCVECLKQAKKLGKLANQVLFKGQGKMENVDDITLGRDKDVA